MKTECKVILWLNLLWFIFTCVCCWERRTDIFFAEFAFVSLNTTVTHTWFLVTNQNIAVYRTVIFAVLSVQRTLTLGTFPSDRITGPTLLWAFCTVLSKVIWRAYCWWCKFQRLKGGSCLQKHFTCIGNRYKTNVYFK